MTELLVAGSCDVLLCWLVKCGPPARGGQHRGSVQLQPLRGHAPKSKSTCLPISLQQVTPTCPNPHLQHTCQKLLHIPPLFLKIIGIYFLIIDFLERGEHRFVVSLIYAFIG